MPRTLQNLQELPGGTLEDDIFKPLVYAPATVGDFEPAETAMGFYSHVYVNDIIIKYIYKNKTDFKKIKNHIFLSLWAIILHQVIKLSIFNILKICFVLYIFFDDNIIDINARVKQGRSSSIGA